MPTGTGIFSQLPFYYLVFLTTCPRNTSNPQLLNPVNFKKYISLWWCAAQNAFPREQGWEIPVGLGECSKALQVFAKWFCEKIYTKVPTGAARNNFSLRLGNKRPTLTALLSGGLVAGGEGQMVTEGAQRSGSYWERYQKGNPPQNQEVGLQLGGGAKSKIFIERAPGSGFFQCQGSELREGKDVDWAEEASLGRGGGLGPQIPQAEAARAPWGSIRQEDGMARPSIRASLLSSKCSRQGSLSWVLLQALFSLEWTSASGGSVFDPSKTFSHQRIKKPRYKVIL